ncbi:MAG: hypothetical protein JWQ89_4016 [Devosia sp.]|nr:hypothetical protein [Devosia sp.]
MTDVTDEPVAAEHVYQSINERRTPTLKGLARGNPKPHKQGD